MCDTCDPKEVLEIVKEIERLADEMPEAGEEFAADVLETAQDMAEWIEDKQHVSSRQLEALQNMRDGLERWYR